MHLNPQRDSIKALKSSITVFTQHVQTAIYNLNCYRHQNTIYNRHQSSGSNTWLTSHLRCPRSCMGL